MSSSSQAWHCACRALRKPYPPRMQKNHTLWRPPQCPNPPALAITPIFTANQLRQTLARHFGWNKPVPSTGTKPPQQACDYHNPPFARWFADGQLNLCHNAVDRHLAQRADQPAIIAVSTETNTERVYTFAQLHEEVQRMAAVLQSFGVGKGDRVQIYMPMIAEAAFAMLACVRLGAIHSVVFGGFASVSLASRIDDAQPKVVISADAGSRGGKAIAYKPLLDEALQLAKHKPAAVLLVDRGLAPMPLQAGRDHLWSTLRTQPQFSEAKVPCTWLNSSDPSYILYTSGTTGKPKGVQRDTGGYAVALASSMQHVFAGQAGQTFFAPATLVGWWGTATSSMAR